MCSVRLFARTWADFEWSVLGRSGSAVAEDDFEAGYVGLCGFVDNCPANDLLLSTDAMRNLFSDHALRDYEVCAGIQCFS